MDERGEVRLSESMSMRYRLSIDWWAWMGAHWGGLSKRCCVSPQLALFIVANVDG